MPNDMEGNMKDKAARRESVFWCDTRVSVDSRRGILVLSQTHVAKAISDREVS